MPLTTDRAKLGEVIGQVDRAFGGPLLITLPLECRPRKVALASYSLGMLLLATLGLSAMLCVVVIPTDVWFKNVLLFAAGGLFAFHFSRLSFYALRAVRAPSAALILDSEGFEDQRIQLRVAWRQIGHAKISSEAIRIARKSSTPQGDELRGRHADELVIPLAFLGPARGAAAGAMGVMIENAGGEVEWR